LASEIYIERKSRERGAENNKNTLKGGNPETTGGGAECSQRQNHAAAISPGTEETRRSFSTKSKYFEGNKSTIKHDDLLRVGSCAPSISSLVENVERRLPGKEQTSIVVTLGFNGKTCLQLCFIFIFLKKGGKNRLHPRIRTPLRSDRRRLFTQ
jgi:hypothetical protein